MASRRWWSRNGPASSMSSQCAVSWAGIGDGSLMHVSDGFTDAIGNTPLIRLRRLSEETGCEILGKAEFMNPGGSVKDRAAGGIIPGAERRGEARPRGNV